MEYHPHTGFHYSKLLCYLLLPFTLQVIHSVIAPKIYLNFVAVGGNSDVYW